MILTPVTSVETAVVTASAAALATLSKYIFAYKRKHIFNPAAIALVIIGLFGRGEGSWWVGSSVLLPFVLIVGLLIVRKIRRFSMFLAFLISSSIFIITTSLNDGFEFTEILVQMFTSFPIIFFGTVMLTEPLTTPPTRKLQVVYGLIAGILFALKFNIGPIYSTPELALVIANIFSFIVSPKTKPILTLTNKEQIGADIYEFSFSSDQKLDFKPGQYLEWTLPHKKHDDRGNRRYFTIASSPTESEVKLGVKIIPNDSSSYKIGLLNLKDKGKLAAAQLSGDFVLPENQSEKLVFIAGGIGITPFRSMLKFLIDKKQKRDIVLLYTSVNSDNFVYKDVFETAAKAIDLKTVYVLTSTENANANWNGQTGYITEETIKKEVPNYKERTYYLSGSGVMVDSYQTLLVNLGINKSKIKIDYFPGF